MKTNVFKRTLSLFMALLLAVSGLATTAFAAGESGELLQKAPPRI